MVLTGGSDGSDLFVQTDLQSSTIARQTCQIAIKLAA